MITREEVLKRYDYDRQNGVFLRKKKYGKHKVGDIAGSKNLKGYRQMVIDYKTYYVHRLVWLCEKGYHPEHTIKHRDGDKSNNRISNLYKYYSIGTNRPDYKIKHIVNGLRISHITVHDILRRSINKVFLASLKNGLSPYEAVLGMTYLFRIDDPKEFKCLIRYLYRRNLNLVKDDIKNGAANDYK